MSTVCLICLGEEPIQVVSTEVLDVDIDFNCRWRTAKTQRERYLSYECSITTLTHFLVKCAYGSP
jgi:hypothetical protein